MRARLRGAFHGSATAPSPHLRPTVFLVGIAYLVMGLAWAISQPVPAGIDEATHYDKALGNAQLEFVGKRAPSPYRPPIPSVLVLADQSTRAFDVPGPLAALGIYSCAAADPTQSAKCTEAPGNCARYFGCGPADPNAIPAGSISIASYDGDYEPTLYMVPGVFAHFASDNPTGVRMARIGSVLVMAVLVIVAAALLIAPRDRGYSLLGLPIAISPMVVHLNSVINPSGPETMLSICFFASLLRLHRDRERARSVVWLAAGVTGGTLSVSRITGTVWVAIAVVTLIALVGPKTLVRLVRDTGRSAYIAIALLGCGVIADFLWWQVAVGRPHGARPLSDARYYILESFDQLPLMFVHQVGQFGWLDVEMGGLFYVTWAALAVSLLTLAFIASTVRQRVVLGSTCLAVVAGTVVLDAMLRVTFGYPTSGMEGRYVLPLTVMPILLAGELLYLNRGRLGALAPRRPMLLTVAVASVTQFAAFWADGRRYATGVNGPFFFLSSADWQPPLGWVLWLAVLLIGLSLLTTASVIATGSRLRASAPHQLTAHHSSA